MLDFGLAFVRFRGSGGAVILVAGATPGPSVALAPAVAVAVDVIVGAADAGITGDNVLTEVPLGRACETTRSRDCNGAAVAGCPCAMAVRN